MARMNLDYPAWHKQHSRPAGIPPKEKAPRSALLQLCPECFTMVGPGKPHKCSKRTQQDNLENILNNSSTETRHLVTGRSLKSLAKESGVSVSGGTLPLQTQGPVLLPVRLGKGRGDDRNATVISHQQMMELQLQTNISDSKLLEIRRCLGVWFGNKKLEPYLKAALTDRNKDMVDFFSYQELTFQSKVKGKEEEVVRPVISANLPALITFLLQERNLDPDNTEITFGLDDGQGILKIMMIMKEEPGRAEPPRQRARHSEGVSNSKNRKLSGVKKLIGKLVWECIETSSK